MKGVIIVLAVNAQATAMRWNWNWILAPHFDLRHVTVVESLAAWAILGMATSAPVPKGRGSAELDPRAELWVGVFGMTLALILRRLA